MTSTTSHRTSASRHMPGGDFNFLMQQNSEDLAHQNGRPEARDYVRELARRALTAPAGDPALEIPPGAEEFVTWDASPEEAGRFMPGIEADDEADFAAAMAVEGRREAEQGRRRAAHAEAD